MVSTNGITFTYDLVVDGRSVTTALARPEPLPMPGWGWVLVGACAAIPVLTMGGAVPAALGGGGAFGCYSTARNANLSASARVARCLGITGMSWVGFIIFILVLGPYGAKPSG